MWEGIESSFVILLPYIWEGEKHIERIHEDI
jgi:hypothetical protein